MTPSDAPSTTVHDDSRGPRASRLWWQAAAAGVALITFGACALLVRGSLRQRDEMRAVLAQVRRPYDQQLAAIGMRLSAQASLIARLADPDVRVIDLRPSAPGAAARATARVFWRPATHGWTLFARGLAAPPKGGVFHLWFVLADGARHDGGVLVEGAPDVPALETTYDGGGQRIEALAITVEDAASRGNRHDAPVLQGRVGPP
jgi:Anti-sigma-K factor rskA, C-terminal